MLANSRTPIVFLACINSYRRGKRLRYLVHERKAIANILNSGSESSVYQPVEKGNRANDFFLEMLRNRQFRNRVTMLHFVGHAENNFLRMESEEFETPVSIEQISELVAQLPNLQAVFLSGCATPRLLEVLLQRDIPAVFVTQTREKDPHAAAIAKTFYETLVQGASLQEAFAETSRMHPDMQPIEVGYDVDSDSLTWEGKELLFNGLRLPWGMYYLADNAERLKEGGRIKPLVVPLNKHRRSSWRKKFRRGVGWVAMAVLLGLLGVGLTLYIQRPEEVINLIAYF
ncbi:MAG: CHAT domain-containing protein [Bacteroidota bacterium]